MTDFFYMSI